MNEVDCKSLNGGNGIVYGGGSYVKLNVTCHNYGKKGPIKKYHKSKGNFSSGNPPKNSANELTEWVTKNTVLSYTNDLATATMDHNSKK